jgi:hypothetical protein
MLDTERNTEIQDKLDTCRDVAIEKQEKNIYEHILGMDETRLPNRKEGKVHKTHDKR